MVRHQIEKGNALTAVPAEGRHPALVAALGALAAALLCLLLSAPAQAATYQQTGVFAGGSAPLTEEETEADEEIQLGGVSGMAVNRTGAGGVPRGTLYAVMPDAPRLRQWEGTGLRVAMFEPKPSGGLTFVESWKVTSSEGSYERCGPLLGLHEVDGSQVAIHPCKVIGYGGGGAAGIDVDQSTGQVYVLGSFYTSQGGEDKIIAYSADGGEVVTRFGEQAPSGEGIPESPRRVHNGTLATKDRLGVDSATGDVYVFDDARTTSGGLHSRLMVFGPRDGDRGEYEYLGEILPQTSPEESPRAPVFDDAGHLYVAGINEGGDHVEEFATPPAPAAYPASQAHATCSFHFEAGGILSMTVDPASGEPFFYSYKRETKAHWVRQLGPCQGGHFEETGKFPILGPELGDLTALAFDPEARAEPSRDEGVLYGAAPNGEPTSGVGEPLAGSARGYVFGAPVHGPHPPKIEAESVSRVTATGAALHATLNPEGFATRYVFQYETQARYETNPPEERFVGASEAPAGGAPAGEGTQAIPLATQIAGLSPSLEYRFRVVAVNHGCPDEPEELCVEPGEAGYFRTFPILPFGLGDGRVYELVSPAQKNGGQVVPADPGISSCVNFECKIGGSYQHFPMQSSPDGNEVVFEGGNFGLGGPVRENAYLARRTEAGWQSANLTPDLLSSGGGYGYKAFSADLSRGILEQGQSNPALVPGAPSGYPTLYSQSSGDPASLTALMGEPPHRSREEFSLRFAAASSDGSRVFFAANDALTPEAEDGGASKFNLYEWHDGNLALVNVMPGGETEAGASFGTASANTVSADGSRAFFSNQAGQIFVRIGASGTSPVSESRRSTPDPLGARPAEFLVANADGARALFSSSEELTDDSNTGLAQEIDVDATAGTYQLSFRGQTTVPLTFNAPTGRIRTALEGLSTIGAGNVAVTRPSDQVVVVTFTGALADNREELSVDGSGLTGTVSLQSAHSGRDLYLWSGGSLVDLTPGQGSNAFQGVVGTSADLSQIYFVDQGTLASEPNEVGEVAEPGRDNLYVSADGEGVRFIAHLAATDSTGGGGFAAGFMADWAAVPADRTAEASPSGRYLAFLSTERLTGFDADGQCNFNHAGGYAEAPCPEAFLYDSATGRLVCASCDPSGAAPLGRTVLRRIQYGSFAPQPRYLTDSGRLYFDTRDSLVPGDTNEGWEDVYEWEPRGTGSCQSGFAEGGCVTLISSGHGSADSNLVTIDESGGDVFFTTRDQLALKDKDELSDLYDAREGGGIAAETETQRAECQGEACQPVVTPPGKVTPGSATFEGAGNVREEKPQKKHPRGKRHKKHTKHKKHRHRRGQANRHRGGAK